MRFPMHLCDTMFWEHSEYYVIEIALVILVQFAIISMLLVQRRRNIRAAQALRENNAIYRVLTDNASDMISRHAADGCIMYVSPACKHLFGYPPDEMIGQPVERFVHPDDISMTWGTIHAALTSGNDVYSVQHRTRHKQGHWVWVETKGHLLRDLNGGLQEIYCLVRDITERKQTEEALSFQKALLEAEHEASPDGILVVSLKGDILSYNQRFVELWRIPPDMITARQDEAVLQFAFAQVVSAEDFLTKVRYLYAHPDEQQREEIMLKDGRVFDRYTTPISSREGANYGRVWFFRDITDYKRAEASRREWEQRYALIVAASGQVVYDYDVPTGAILWGHTIEAVLGYPPSEINQGIEQWAALLHPDDRQKTLDSLSNAEAACGYWDAEYRMQHKDGRFVWMRDRGFFVPDVHGKAVRQLGLMENITERKQTEEALRESEERLRSFIEQTSEGVAIIDEDGRIIEWNAANERISGYLRTEMVGSYAWDALIRLVSPESRTSERRIQLERMLRETLSTGQIVSKNPAEFAYNSVNGEQRVVQQNIFPIKTARGYRLGTLTHDITERKRTEEELQQYREQLEELVKARTAELQHEIAAHEQAEQSLRENEANVKALIENTDSMILSIDRNYRLIVGNSVFLTARKIALGKDYVKGEDVLSDPTPQAFRELWYGYYNRALAGEKFSCEEHREFPHKGEWWEFRLSPIQSVTGEILGVTILGRDITAQKQVEEELRQAKEAAEAANRAKSIFLANMSHELRTPLNAILGFAQLLTRETTLSPVQQEYLGTINRSGEHLLKLINDVLDMSKIEAGRMILHCTSFDLWKMLANIEEMIRIRIAQKGLQFSVERLPDVPRYINTDENKLRQVLINLLGNAVKFTEKGTIQLKITHETLHMEHAAHTILHFSITDTGKGIAPEDLTSIFEAFRQTSHSYNNEGTGLGLTISRKFIQLMGGEIQVHSEIDGGSCFTFSIQVELAESGSLSSLPVTRNVRRLASQHSPIRILVVEDQVENRQFLLKLLTTVGFDVRIATNGQEAVTQAVQWSPHLILMDMRMPVMDGYHATQNIRNDELKEKKTQTPIIALTASAFEEDFHRILAAGCNAVLRKPVNATELFEIIRIYLDIQYIYEEEESRLPADTPIAVPQEVLTPTAFAQLPQDVLHQLAQAALHINTKAMEQVIAVIRTYNSSLADALSVLAKTFRYQDIWKMIPHNKEEEHV